MSGSKKITIIGAGNAGCISALSLLENKYEDSDSNIGEIEIIYDPEAPIERVGQASVVDVHQLMFKMLDMNWFSKNLIKATPKTGVRYKDWGDFNHNFFHPFNEGNVACHFVPKLLSQAVLDQNDFNVKTTRVDSSDEIDSDFVIDCRGKPSDMSQYNDVKHPLNSALLCEEEHSGENIYYTGHVATPHGWTFVIPNVDTISFGYLFNSNITSRAEALQDFRERFLLKNTPTELSFETYLAKNIWQDERTILNGNNYCFIEPLEATSTSIYRIVTENLISHIDGFYTKDDVQNHSEKLFSECAYFVNRHYKFGSKFNTPFWDYAKTLETPQCEKYQEIIKTIGHWDALRLANYNPKPNDNLDLTYGTWYPRNLMNWEINMNNTLTNN